MTYWHNSGVRLDPVQAKFAFLHEPQHFAQQQVNHQVNSPSQSPSTVLFTLPTFYETLDHPRLGLVDGKYSEGYEDRTSTTFGSSSSLPSPPSTNSDPKHPIPLPTNLEPINDMCFSFSWSKSPGAILDSPGITRSLLSTRAPPSPPPTVPLAAAELPPEAGTLSPMFTVLFPAEDAGPSSRRLPSCPNTPLSPISPDLGPNRITTIHSPRESTYRDQGRWQEGSLGMQSMEAADRAFGTGHRYTLNDVANHDPQYGYLLRSSPPRGEHIVPPDAGDHHIFFLPKDDLQPYNNNSSNYGKNLYDRPPPLSIDIPISGRGWLSHFDDDLGSSDYRQLETPLEGLSFLEHDSNPDYMDVDIKSSSDSYLSPQSPGQDIKQDLLLDSLSSFPHPSSPSIRKLSPLPSVEDEPKLFDDIRECPDHDDMVLSSPSSPSLRRFSSLPDMEEDTSDHLVTPPGSPGLSSLDLPMADEDFNPSNIALSVPDRYTRSLLLDDFDTDPIPPRSPSPDIFTIDPALLQDSADPELSGLYELQWKAQAAVKAARAREVAIVEEEGNVHDTYEARLAVKREKTRVKEIRNLLRLKLKEKGAWKGKERGESEDSSSGPTVVADEGSPRKKPAKPKITSTPQLVANMILSRHELKPMYGRKPTVLPSSSSIPKIRSPLGLANVGDIESDDLGGLGLVGFNDLSPEWDEHGEVLLKSAVDGMIVPTSQPSNTP